MSQAAVELSPALALAGYRLVVDGCQLVVVDADGQELERAGRRRWVWLLAVCEQLLIELLVSALGTSELRKVREDARKHSFRVTSIQ